ncbi:MAG: Inosine/uridine-preferring nucleoside hydrolase [Phycisphaerales bacterium]|nr:Inosine/uridine-preferring nucleoside hydrolase [Phycisphaerales bacterium]
MTLTLIQPTMRDFLIDTDTASDDAVALIMALRHADVNVRGITTVAGNVGVEQATQNALLVTELCESDAPVFTGCAKPMLRPISDASWFHGRDGLSDIGLVPRLRSASPGHAVDAILSITQQYPGLTLVTLGPLTNIATALMRDPDIARRVGRCVIMGGNPCCVGNVTPAAEYNIWCDPEAAQIVVQSGMPIELVGWHISRGDAVLNAGEIADLQSFGTPLATFAVNCNRTAMNAYRTQTGENGISLPDPTAMAVALDPSIVTSASEHRLMIECHSELTRGMTVVDQLNVADDARNQALWHLEAQSLPPAGIVWSIDVPAFKQMVMASLL